MFLREVSWTLRMGVVAMGESVSVNITIIAVGGGGRQAARLAACSVLMVKLIILGR
jgi:hypothetical protein